MLLMLIVVAAVLGAMLALVAAWHDRWACHWCARQNWPWRHVCWNCELVRKVEA